MLSDDTSDSNHVVSEGKAETDGKTETDGNKPKEKDKKYRSAPPTKVVIRRLPPTMTLEKFIDQVSPLPENDYLYFAKADASLGQHSFCTAYVNFVQPKDVFIFKEKFDDYIFIDNKGNEFPAVVEFAPFQKIPRKKSRQRDPKCGTIDSDPDYLAFVAQMKQTVEETPDTGMKSTGGKSSPLLSMQDVLEEIEAKERDRKCRKATTPLIEYIKQRKMERQRMKDEKKEERKRREVERKRAKEEERKHRREANREAIQGKRDRKEQRRDGGTRHEDRLSSKPDSGHASKPSADNRQSPPPGGGDILKLKKEADFSYDDADDDDEEEGAEEEEDEADQDLYDQEQTQKLKEILRIGTVCKGSEKGSQGEYSSDVEVSNTKKGTEKGPVTNYERSRGSGDWERGNRSQRVPGAYNEEYHGARPKLNRSDGGGHERRNAKEKKQNDQRQYGESRNREKPGKVWLAKNEARHQKICEERIRIQKADGERGNREEHVADKNGPSVKEEDTSEMELKANSPASEDSGQPPPSSQETTPSSEVEDLVEAAQSEQKSCREGLSEKSSVEAEGRNKSSSSSKGSRDSGTSSNQNTSNGEMRRMRNKVGTSRDSGSLKMIKNKDRPSIEIYRPGMRRFNLQKKEAAESGGSTKQSGNTAASNTESPGETNSSSLGSGYSAIHGASGNTKGKEREDKRRMSGGRGGGNKRRDGSWKQGEDGANVRHERSKGRDDRGRGNWGSQGESMKSCGDGNARERFDDKPIKDDLVEVRSMTFKRSVSRD